MDTRPFDVALWGVTGFTGSAVLSLLGRGFISAQLRIALVGRSRSKLNIAADVIKGCVACTAIALPEWDAAGSLEGKISLVTINFVRQSRCVIALAGPFADFGEPVLAACARSGTHYVDITGEVDWVRAMHAKYDSVARESGAKIMPCCGFDFLLNDLGYGIVSEECNTRDGPPSPAVSPATVIQQSVSVGGFQASGGTLRTALRYLRARRCGDVFRTADRCSIWLSAAPTPLYTRAAGRVWADALGTWLAPGFMTPGQVAWVQFNDSACAAAAAQPPARLRSFLVGERAAGALAAWVQTAFMFFASLALWLCSRSRLLEWLFVPRAGSGVFSLASLARKGNYVEVVTAGQFAGGRVTHKMRFAPGEAYLMTAAAVLCVVVVALQEPPLAAAAADSARSAGGGGVRGATRFFAPAELANSLVALTKGSLPSFRSTVTRTPV